MDNTVSEPLFRISIALYSRVNIYVANKAIWGIGAFAHFDASFYGFERHILFHWKSSFKRNRWLVNGSILSWLFIAFTTESRRGRTLNNLSWSAWPRGNFFSYHSNAGTNKYLAVVWCHRKCSRQSTRGFLQRLFRTTNDQDCFPWLGGHTDLFLRQFDGNFLPWTEEIKYGKSPNVAYNTSICHQWIYYYRIRNWVPLFIRFFTTFWSGYTKIW